MKDSSFPGLSSWGRRAAALLIAVMAGSATFAQDTTSYSILVAGHAYGAHAGTNLGLHQPLIDKLLENRDTTVKGLFLTGDIVNTSTAASWAQVEKELTAIGYPSYYVMGNHDNNTIGRATYRAKHGGLYYSFQLHSDLYIILNSTESDRSISSTQLAFLTDVLQKADTSNRRVFIFFHEVIWNSHVKYRLVRSNSRSRYDQIKSVSNFWQKVVPIFDTYPERNFYLFAGDVGGNPDAIAAFYDRWGHMTLLASGIGEVPDENYMKVNITPDTVTFSLIALNSKVRLEPVTSYSVPGAPAQITGPAVVNPPVAAVKYEVPPVSNATSYKWTFAPGITGSSDTSTALLTFDGQYQTGQISVRAVKDGFGESDPVYLNVKSSAYTDVNELDENSALRIHQTQQSVFINCSSDKPMNGHLKIYNASGRLLYNQSFRMRTGLNTRSVDKHIMGKGFVVVQCSFEGKVLNQKMMVY